MNSAAPSPPAAARRRTWPWAIGSVAAVLLVVAATLGGHAAANRARASADQVPAPALPLADALALARPGTGAVAWALDAATSPGRLFALAASRPAACAAGATVCVPTADLLVVLDDATGATLARVPLTGSAAVAQGARALVVDAAGARVYAVGPRGIVVFSALAGAPLGAFAPPAAAPVGAAFDVRADGLVVLGRQAITLLDAQSGRVLARQPLPASADAAPQGPVLDPAAGECFVLWRQPGDAATLLAYALPGLAPLARVALPAAARLGPLMPGGAQVVIFGANAITWLVTPPGVRRGAVVPPPAVVPAWSGAAALGWDPPRAQVYLARAGDVRVLAGASGAPLRALPLGLAPDWPSWLALPVDAARGSAALPLARGAVVLLRDAALPSGSAGMLTASILARAALARFLPPTGQTPPFLSVATFPPGPASWSTDFAVHSSEVGWLGPYPGAASASVARMAGGYQVTFTVAWEDLLLRQHRWVLAVSSAGAVRLLASTGDAIP